MKCNISEGIVQFVALIQLEGLVLTIATPFIEIIDFMELKTLYFH